MLGVAGNASLGGVYFDYVVRDILVEKLQLLLREESVVNLDVAQALKEIGGKAEAVKRR